MQRYFICDKYWGQSPGGARGPIFFYAGNEADVTVYVNATGLMWENAHDFGALIVFAEHRYYGKTQPFGPDSWAVDPSYLTVEQAMSDYATLIWHLLRDLQAEDSPVIAFGGSYGGMLAAWMRVKYPHLVAGAVAASAPVGAFPGVWGWEPSRFWEVVTYDATEPAGSLPECAPNVRSAFKHLMELGATEQGRTLLRRLLRLCDPIQDEAAAVDAAYWLQASTVLQGAFDAFAMGNYPYPSSYISDNPDHPLPAWPMRAACLRMAGTGLHPTDLIEALREAAGVLYNVTGDVKCYDTQTSGPAAGNRGPWDYQWCTELMAQELPYYPATGVSDMFWDQGGFDFDRVNSHCREAWGVTPRPHWSAITYGGLDFRYASNIVFSNGLYDPWSGFGVLTNVSDSVVAVIIPEAPGQALQLSPSGVIRLVYPKGDEYIIGLDVFAVPDAYIRASLNRSLEAPDLSIDGPLPPPEGSNITGVLVVRQAIFVRAEGPQESFGRPDQPNVVCGAQCGYNATSGTMFWGFASGTIFLDAQGVPVSSAGLSPMRFLEERGFRYALIAPRVAGKDGPTVVASSAVMPSDGVEAALHVTDVEWILVVGPRDGWFPAWYGGLVAAVILLSLAASMMLFAILVSRRQNQMLLAALLPRELIRDLRNEKASSLGPRHFHSESPADLLMALLGRLLAGQAPDLRDVVLLRTVLLQHMDVYKPLDINDRIKDAQLDNDVASALMRQLGTTDTMGGKSWPEVGIGLATATSNAARSLRASVSGRMPSQLSDCPASASRQRELQLREECQSLPGALAYIIVADMEAEQAVATAASARRQVVPLSADDDAVAGSGMLTPASCANEDASSLAAEAASARSHGTLSTLQRQPSAGTPRFSGSGVFLRVGTSNMGPADGVLGSAQSLSRCVVVLPPTNGTAAAEAASSLLGGGGGGPHMALRVQARAGPVPGDHGLPGPYAAGDAALPAAAAGTLMPAHGEGGSRSILGSPCPEALASMQHSMYMPPPRAMVDEVERLLAQVDSWQFDTWALQEASGGHALSVLGYYLIQRAGLMERFRIEPLTLARLLRTLESGYSSSNPYHNATHAADVLRSLHVLLHGARMTAHYLDPLGLLAAYFAAVVHDYGHHGLTNDFLIATSHPLAVRYNDRCPMESHHCAAAFSLLAERPEVNALAGLTRTERNAFRKQVIELVLATDMKQHFAILNHFTAVHKISSTGAPSGKQLSGRSPLTPESSGRHFARDVSSGTPAEQSITGDPVPIDDAERLLSLQVALKVADIGHLGADQRTHKRWLSVLEEEFFAQGDRERQLGLSISPLFDREKQGVSKSQVGFFKVVALPLVNAFVSAFPGASPMMRCFVTNYEYW
ncbi:hypothetical protein GPECTOR_21g678 [Gonium pectorale]|uniref:Phosphodiesterase n=1 Tax=Gonium pectorale TaxID=33097 RepID=A0A150GHZ0_GONPE|nr:hypothetical protein GPECTOR_21g678 [Gonium pectorale]|eukprot:KXZ49452.1 hypothetical protein GPECTOR_21g678 [Gonium pectorale]